MLKWPVWIGVVCEDLEAQRRFYRDTLGLKEVRAEESFVWFEFEGRLLELWAKSDKPEYDRKRVSFAFEVEDIRLARVELLARGAEALTDIRRRLRSGPVLGLLSGRRRQPVRDRPAPR